MKKVILSIIIVSFNTREYVRSCLKSIEKSYTEEIYSGQYEVVIVDNASTDESVAMIRKQFPYVTVIVQKENVGFAAANNAGIKKSKGTYILLLNPDTIVNASVLPRIIDVFEKENNVGVVTCKVVLQNGALDDACHRGFPTPWRALCHFSGLSKIFPHSMFFNGYHLGYHHMDRMHEIDACVGAFMMIRRSVGESINWLDEDYFWYGEDLDFCYRVKEKGYKVMFVPDVSILHYKGVASGIKSHSKHIAVADRETRLKATHARFEVMRIFYHKHYADRYPWIMKQLVLWGISLKEFITIHTL